MAGKKNDKQLFCTYFKEWVELYKEGAVRDVTLQKYRMTLQRLEELAPSLKLAELDRKSYQNLLNEYAKTHEKQTVADFHHQLKGAIMDAIDDGLIEANPTRKVTIKGKAPRDKKPKFLNQFEVQSLLRQMNLGAELNWDWFLLLIVKTGLRFSEALGLTPTDFDFSKQLLNVSKSWNYKDKEGGFQDTKNESSNRKVLLDWQTAMQFSTLVKELEPEKPIFVKGRIFNSTVNDRLEMLCESAQIPVISVHGLRHTHASLLIFGGVSIASVAKRLGHSSMTTTQETYLHIIKELENQDSEKIMKHLSSLT